MQDKHSSERHPGWSEDTSKRFGDYFAPDPIDQPSALFDQIKWLEAAGLTSVDVHWLKAGHAIFSGFKTEQA